MPSEDGKIRYAVVGGGAVAQGAFMPGVAQTGNSRLAALVTGDALKAERLAGLYAIKAYAYQDYGKLLCSGEIDAVYVATPNFRHREFVVPALEAGIHVLLEKPMAASEADCHAMIEAANRTGSKLMIAYRLHTEPGTLEILERVQGGELGEPCVFTSTFTRRILPGNHRASHGFASGPVPDLGTYPLNMARHLFAAEPVEVSAFGSRLPDSGLDTQDTVTVVLRFPGERLAQFTVSHSLPASERFQVIGDQGEIEASPCFGYGQGAGIAYRVIRDGVCREQVHPAVDQFAGETAWFSDCILADREPQADGNEGWRDVRVIMAIKRALETGHAQVLEPLPFRRLPMHTRPLRLALPAVPAFIDGGVEEA